MRSPRRPRPGFTLVELLIGMALSAVVMTALLGAFVYFARNFARLANSQLLEEQARLALAWVRTDVARAREIKRGTAPADTTVTLVLPDGEVTYTYDAAAQRLRRQATFGAAPDLVLLGGRNCACTAFAFSFYTGSLGAPVDQSAPAVNVPYSVKQLRLSFTLQTTAVHAPETRVRRDIVSARYVLRQRSAPDGS
ncbi:MAG TPA: prepilin-type N-terminal cleavage/methylation domain-containing protein [Opitutaceae bacterium]|nr:prepilin-type N-terminal cleavage/methylation domain-containing protein [Opitutaceae bacterium]